MNRDLCNFARIEFDRLECEALRELREFVEQCAPKHVMAITEDVVLARRIGAVRRAVNNMGKKIAGKNLQPVDLTKDECEAIDFMAEGMLGAMRENTLGGMKQAQRIGHFAVVLSRVRMKCSMAAQAIKPNIATDLRLL